MPSTRVAAPPPPCCGLLLRRARARCSPRGALLPPTCALSPFVASKLASAERTHRELSLRLADPEVASDPKAYNATAKQLGALTETVDEFARYTRLVASADEAAALGREEPEMAAMAAEEAAGLLREAASLEGSLTRRLLPRDPLDEKNIMLEIRAGTGGEEAGLWCSDLLRMYSRFADTEGWKTQLLSSAEMESGGLREATLQVSGASVYSKLKWEAGVHRVQRVPATETQGRVHTSTATVAVMPEADEVDVVIDPKKITLSTARSSGAGGQNVNKGARLRCEARERSERSSCGREISRGALHAFRA